MKKLVISIFSCFVSHGYSEAYLSDFSDVIHSESLEKKAFLQERLKALKRVWFIQKNNYLMKIP